MMKIDPQKVTMLGGPPAFEKPIGVILVVSENSFRLEKLLILISPQSKQGV